MRLSISAAAIRQTARRLSGFAAACFTLLAPAIAQVNTQHSEAVAATTALSESTGIHHEQLSIYPVIMRDRVDAAAAAQLQAADAVLAQAANTVDASSVTADVARLGAYQNLDSATVSVLTSRIKAHVEQLAQAVAAFRQSAAQSAAQAAAQAEQQRIQSNSPDAARETARSIASAQFGWGDDQYQCLDKLWQKESGWSYTASNASGATGIPQALPGSKMATTGADWQTNATTQINWGLGYIARGYGTPCSAWAHSVSSNWY
ncbi:MAG: hypothetical protein ABI255_07115 [Microbacteriaceae bacterium]